MLRLPVPVGSLLVLVLRLVLRLVLILGGFLVLRLVLVLDRFLVLHLVLVLVRLLLVLVLLLGRLCLILVLGRLRLFLDDVSSRAADGFHHLGDVRVLGAVLLQGGDEMAGCLGELGIGDAHAL